MKESLRRPSLLQAFIPILFLISILSINVYIYGSDGLSGSNQIVLILSTGVACLVASRLGMSFDAMVKGMVHSINSAMPSILILLLIGSLAGTWLISGIVPAMIYYGLKILNPVIFLFAACTICAIVSLATGSSWTTVATIGIALLGIGKALGMSEGVIAGAIISGAYFGDKMSPLSDTTNLAPAVAGTDLFTHIRYMIYTTGPSILITLIIFLVMGFSYDSEASQINVGNVMQSLENNFNLNPLLFAVPAIVLFMIIKKVPALPALLAGTLLGGIFALIFQVDIVVQVSGETESFAKACYMGIMQSMFGDIAITTENEAVNQLLSTGGMAGMLNTIWLIISAMVFGGIMEASGMLHRITELIIEKAKSTGTLIASTAGTCIFFNLTASDQYLAIVIPGKMFSKTYGERGLVPENLSRTLEDSGTVTSVLIPWNTCGATQAGVLGVATITYLPYCFFNIISPFMTILFGYLNIKIRKMKSQATKPTAMVS
ncbi:Na+/H+ antiporter NhaC [Rapidithrix thailandica]|uniref:Na+/H+ antiporter NhaC n=1 Tax=Rapidithrix thailandica TaxID=413964 RepID=A0AAW9RVV2_9BACT